MQENGEKGKNVWLFLPGRPDRIFYIYLCTQTLMEQLGYATEIVSGITSFCAVSARFNEGTGGKNPSSFM